MMRFFLQRRDITPAIFLVVSLTICSGARAESRSPSTSTLKIGTTINQLESLLPIHQVPGQSHFLRNLVAPPFLHLDLGWRWQCRVCLRIPSLSEDPTFSNSKNKNANGLGLTTQWEISPQVNWGDGTNVTGYDVQYTINQLRKFQRDPVLQENFPVKEIVVDAENPRKFRLTVKRGYADYYQILAVSLLPMHKKELFENTKDSHKKEIIEAAKDSPENHLEDLLIQPFWSYGPYRIISVSGNTVTLVPNERYTGNRPAWNNIVLHHFSKKSDMLQAMKTGTIDMIADGEMTLDDVAFFAEETRPVAPASGSVQVVSTPSNDLEQITMNLRNPAFGDVRLRKALIQGINRARIVADIYHNHALLADNFLNPHDPNYASPTQIFAYRPDLAASLLEDAGWKLTKSGQRFKGDHALSIQIVTRPDPVRMRVLGFIKEDFQKLGIELSIEEIPDTEGFHEYVQSARFRDMTYFTWLNPPGNIPWALFHSGQIPSSRNEYVGQNTGAWSSTAVDAALVDLLMQADPAERQNSINTILGEWTVEVPIIPILFKPRFSAIANTLEGYQLSGNGYHSSLYCEQWRPAAVTIPVK